MLFKYTRHWRGNEPTAFLLRDRNEEPTSNLAFTEEDIRQLLHNINPFCALRPDEVHPRILKETMYTLTKHFPLVFRQSFNEATIPSPWKEASVAPTYKTGIRLSPGIYRHISLTSMPCKHHEKSAQEALATLLMVRRTFSRITRMNFQLLYGAYVRPLLEHANQVVYSGRTKDTTLIGCVQRAATKIVAGLKPVD
ncbi:hypothetical protein CLF_100102 [Clonorchis sinensis]|uniref:RNA-directed DNA polymerase from mobile element jockey n=1 Tax=Clonorchis sinensis TaxID=79923 RepID=G7Y2N7_CLOSI|nr:hypothetical protein CLF_100102 [Clonorchis sinensis]